mgnify:CR=1 FL=1
MLYYYKSPERRPRPEDLPEPVLADMESLSGRDDEMSTEAAELAKRIDEATQQVLEQMTFDERLNPVIQRSELTRALIEAWRKAGDKRMQTDIESAAVREYTRWVNEAKIHNRAGQEPTPNRDAFFDKYPLEKGMGGMGVRVTFDTSEFKDASGEWIEDKDDDAPEQREAA